MNVSTDRRTSLYEAIPELDTPRYVLGDIAAAANVNPGTLKAWLSREPRVVPLGAHDRPGRGKGTPRLFTLRRVYAIAITAELVSLGFVASKAGVLAFDFTDMSTDGGERLVEKSGPLFLAANPTHDLFAWFLSGDIQLDLVLGKEATTQLKVPLVSCTLIDCAALMARVQTVLKKRGAT